MSNTLFRRDAGLLSAYFLDAETAEQHDKLSDGQRLHDIEIARENVAGELLDLAAELGREGDGDPFELADDVVRRYERAVGAADGARRSSGRTSGSACRSGCAS